MMRRLIRMLWLVVAGGCVLTGCASGAPFRQTVRQVECMALVAANQGNATQVDLVLVYSTNMLAMMPGTAPEWFRDSAALRLQAGPDIAVVSLQVPSPSAVFTVKLPKKRRKPVAVLGFANYQSAEGQRVADLTRFKCARMTLAATSVDYSECH